MTMETFMAALEAGVGNGHPCVQIGGGEPTAHPEFWSFLRAACAFAKRHGQRRPWLATNGKRARDAMRLLEWAQYGRIRLTLSQDAYHEPISPVVVAAYRRSGCATLRTHTESVVRPIGRAAGWGKSKLCINACPHVTPDGTIYSCGHRRATWGTVFKPEFPAWARQCIRRRWGNRCSYVRGGDDSE